MAERERSVSNIINMILWKKGVTLSCQSIFEKRLISSWYSLALLRVKLIRSFLCYFSEHVFGELQTNSSVWSIAFKIIISANYFCIFFDFLFIASMILTNKCTHENTNNFTYQYKHGNMAKMGTLQNRNKKHSRIQTYIHMFVLLHVHTNLPAFMPAAFSTSLPIYLVANMHTHIHLKVSRSLSN